jgi:hypothetical protein
MLFYGTLLLFATFSVVAAQALHGELFLKRVLVTVGMPVAAEHYSLALLSNDVAEWSVYLRKNGDGLIMQDRRSQWDFTM